MSKFELHVVGKEPITFNNLLTACRVLEDMYPDKKPSWSAQLPDRCIVPLNKVNPAKHGHKFKVFNSWDLRVQVGTLKCNGVS